jgi:hypothetical protein
MSQPVAGPGTNRPGRTPPPRRSDFLSKVSGDDLDRLIAGARILEDDFAPVDQLLK